MTAHARWETQKDVIYEDLPDGACFRRPALKGGPSRSSSPDNCNRSSHKESSAARMTQSSKIPDPGIFPSPDPAKGSATTEFVISESRSMPDTSTSNLSAKDVTSYNNHRVSTNPAAPHNNLRQFYLNCNTKDDKLSTNQTNHLSKLDYISHSCVPCVKSTVVTLPSEYAQPLQLDEQDRENIPEINGSEERTTTSFFTDPLPNMKVPPSSVMTAPLLYTGSFRVSGQDAESKATNVKMKLNQLKEGVKSKPVLLVISLAGVKVCSPDGKSVYMAHALRRISYATCDPLQRQFTFLAREPKVNYSLQYCHAFLTQTPDQAEELNAIVGHAFRLAYAAHLQKSGAPLRDVNPQGSRTPPVSSSYDSHPAPSHSQLSSLSDGSCRSHSRKSLSTPRSHITSSSYSCSHPSPLFHSSSLSHSSVCSSHVCCSGSHQSIHSHTHQGHCDPAFVQSEKADFEDASSCSSAENSQKASLSSQDCNSSTEHICTQSSIMRTPSHSPAITHQQSGGGLGHCGIKPPSTLPVLHYSHDHENNLLQTPDSDTSNSPTELNTSRRLGDKPPLIKNVNLTNDSNIVFEESRCTNITSCGTSTPSNTFSTQSVSSLSMSQGRLSVIGYVNERINSEKTPISEAKCRLQEEFSLKRISQISVGSSVNCGSMGLDISSCSSHSCTPPPLPERSDSLTPPEEPHLKAAAWFQAGIPREIALEVLSREPVGAFMVRESTSKPGCYALSLRVPRDFTVSGIAHYLIVKTNKGYKIKGFTKEFITLTALITHHSVMPELLPCPLSLSRYNPTFTAEDNNRNDTNDDDPDYNTLSDFRKMMADLNV